MGQRPFHTSPARKEAAMTAFVSSLAAMLGIVPYFAAALVLFFLGKFLFDLSTPRIADDEELTTRDNTAFGVLFTGYMLGLAFALAGVFSSLGSSLIDNLISLGISGLAAIVLMRLSMALGAWLLLPGLDFETQIAKQRNLGAGFALAGLALANGLMIAGVMQGSSESLLGELLDIAVYWAAGQIFLLLAWLLYRLLARFDVVKDLEGSTGAATGLSLAGFFIAAGIVLEAALAGASGDIIHELQVALAVGLSGIVLLAIGRALWDLVILRRIKLSKALGDQDNLAIGAVDALASVAIALLFAALVRSQLG